VRVGSPRRCTGARSLCPLAGRPAGLSRPSARPIAGRCRPPRGRNRPLKGVQIALQCVQRHGWSGGGGRLGGLDRGTGDRHVRYARRRARAAARRRRHAISGGQIGTKGNTHQTPRCCHRRQMNAAEWMAARLRRPEVCLWTGKRGADGVCGGGHGLGPMPTGPKMLARDPCRPPEMARPHTSQYARFALHPGQTTCPHESGDVFGAPAGR
jgi:hypothetical protein